jgi:acyl-[acyl-carrier-protein]-phospholipid O-acyltransferase/long-chain-fatty-acid--[acyl-carrier-protein] ligase
MVPHETIESNIKQILFGNEENEASLHIMGKSDENKGEQLILVIDQEIDFPKLRKNLSENGLPNLWIPKKIQVIAEFPILPTGKVDFLSLKKWVG